MIDKLIEASQAGVQIDMVVREFVVLFLVLKEQQKIFEFYQLLEDIWNILEFIFLVKIIQLFIFLQLI